MKRRQLILFALGLFTVLLAGLPARDQWQNRRPQTTSRSTQPARSHPTFVQRMFTDAPAVRANTQAAARLALALQDKLSAPSSARAFRAKAMPTNGSRKRFLGERARFTVKASSLSEPNAATGSVRVRQGALFVRYIASPRRVIGIVDAVAVNPSRRGAIAKRVAELEAVGFGVNKVVLQYQVALWRRHGGDSLAGVVSRAPDFISPLLSPRETADLLGLKGAASGPAKARISAVGLPPAVAVAAGVAGDSAAPAVRDPASSPVPDETGRPAVVDTILPGDTGGLQDPPPPTEEPQNPEDPDIPNDCILQLVDGNLSQCCGKRYSAFYNCTAFAHDFVKACEASDINCKSVDIECDGGRHRMNLVQLSDGSWVPYEPQPDPEKDPDRSIGVVPGVRLTGTSVPDEAACKMAKVSAEDCGCVQDDATDATVCNCHATVNDNNPQPNSAPGTCADSVAKGVDPDTGKPPVRGDLPFLLPRPDEGAESMLQRCGECCGFYALHAESSRWRDECRSACLKSFRPVMTPSTEAPELENK